MRTIRPQVIITVTAVVLLGLGIRAGGEAAAATAARFKVTATIFPLYDLVRQVAGPTVDVVLLVPPGVSPHTFDAKPSTIRALTGSAAVFAIGHSLDDWAVRLARGVGVSRTVMVDAGVSLRYLKPAAHAHKPATDRGGAVDPHYWLAIANASRMVQNIAAALGQLDAANRKAYLQRAATYREQLDALDHEIRQLFADLPRRDIATFHSAFGYFAEAYALHLVATFVPAPGQDPMPRQVQQFLRQLRTSRLRVLFVEPQLPRSPLSGVARDLGVRLTELDPLGGGEGRGSYIAMMRFNAMQIAASLRE